jgi:DNA-binding NarL/FixJ family response regulator
MPFLTPLLSEAEKRAATAHGATRFATEFAAGQRLSRDAAVDLALGKATASGDVGAARPVAIVNAGPLGAREGEVAGLVAVGLTNKQIGTRLFISERTVDSHVRSIMNKLGVNSRAQIAAWMAAPSD